MAGTNIRGTQIADGSVSLAVDVTGTLPAANGGTGATSLAGAGIATFPLTFNGTGAPAYAQGKLVFDSDNDCLTFFNSDSNVSMQIGQEEWVRVRNVSGATLPNGAAVYITGMNSGLPTVALANASVSTSVVAIGLTTETIANNTNGVVTALGVVHGLNTAAYTAGDTVYLSATTAGALTVTPPAAPNFRYRVGKVTVSDTTNGAIHVTPSTGTLGDGTANQILGMGSSGLAEYKTLIGGTGVFVTHTAGVATVVKTSEQRVYAYSAPGATPAINTDLYDQVSMSGIAAAITSMTSGLSGTAGDGQRLMLRFKDNGTARAITWGAKFVSSGVATLLATTVANKTHMVGLVYDSTAAAWVCLATDPNGY